jgi:hypothetical protein
LEDETVSCIKPEQAVSLFNWFDVMGSVIRRDKSLVFEDWHREDMDDKFLSYVGCPRDVFDFYAFTVQSSTKLSQFYEFDCDPIAPGCLTRTACSQILGAMGLSWLQ